MAKAFFTNSGSEANDSQVYLLFIGVFIIVIITVVTTTFIILSLCFTLTPLINVDDIAFEVKV